MEAAFFFWLTVALCIFVAYLFFASRRKTVTEKGVTVYFQLLCVSVFIWLFSTAFLYVGLNLETMYRVAMWRYVGLAFMTVMAPLHIWQQISPAPLPKKYVVLCCIPPAISSVLAVTNEYTSFFFKGVAIVHEDTGLGLIFENNWGFYFHGFCSYLAGIITLLLILRVFFRIPKSMRRTIILMVYATLFAIVSNVLVLVFFRWRFSYDITIFGSVISLYLFYRALQVTRSSNLIITSREYVWNNLSSMTLVLDAGNLILDYNNSADMIKLGLPLPTFMEPYENFRARWIRSGNGRVSKYNNNVITFGGEEAEKHYRIRFHTIQGEGPNMGSLVEVSEITEIYTLLRYMEDSAQRDHLTGLDNRNSFIKMAPEFCREEHLPLLIIIGDADGLKAVNDMKGHMVGDKLIQKLAEILTECAPQNAFVARIGGDEFILMLPGATEEFGENYIKNVYNRCAQVEGEPYGRPGISLGMAVLRDTGRALHDVIDEADRDMYKNKRESVGGRARYRYNL